MATTLAGLIGAWFILVLAESARGVFVSGPAQPPLPILVTIVGPPVVFVLAYRLSHRFRELVLGFDLRLLTAVQTWRVLGGVFLALYPFGLLPGLFAWPAGLGDERQEQHEDEGKPGSWRLPRRLHACTARRREPGRARRVACRFEPRRR